MLFGWLRFYRQRHLDRAFRKAAAPRQRHKFRPSVRQLEARELLSTIIDNGAAGYSTTGTWHTESVPDAYGGTDQYVWGAGSSTATWQVTGLASGSYTVQASWNPASNEATSAPYAIYDGSTLLTTVDVNQTHQASGTSYGGVPFQTLATVTVRSGTLTVVLSHASTANAYTIADAIGIAPVGTSPPPNSVDLNWSAGGDGIAGPTTISAQTGFTISRTFSVTGGTAPGPFSISYYASTSSSLTQNLANATLLGSETISDAADLAAGNHSGTSPTLQINGTGTYYLFAQLATNSFQESNTTNDVVEASSAVTVPPSGGTIVDNGSAGYSTTGTWHTETVSGSYGGTDQYVWGGGTSAATWQLGGLAPGSYTIQASWNPASNEATSAPYAIYDGTTLLTTVPVNQTQRASGSSYGGVPFQTLATVTINSGTLMVVLGHANTANAYTIADAIRIVAASGTGAVISDTQTGFSKTGTWTSSPASTAYGGMQYTAAAGAASTAQWQFTKLPPGYYLVSANWAAATAQADNAPFLLSDGPRVLERAPANEKNIAAGATNNGYGFAGLATVYVASGTLNVQLAAVGADGIVAADAILVTPATGDQGTDASLDGRQIFPSDNVWNQNISQAPVDLNSAALIASIGLTSGLHADFGTTYNGEPNGIPYIVVPGNQPLVPVTFDDPSESDPGPYPIPPGAPIQGGPSSTGDRHVIILDKDHWILYELYDAYPESDGSWHASSGAVFNLNSDALRPAGWTSADAAGLPILPGLVRYDEVVGTGGIDHALIFTVPKTQEAYVSPATHWASSSTNPDLPPMGMRVRLKASVNISSFPPEDQVILTALKTYGMIVSDNGSPWFVSGAPDPRWVDSDLAMLAQVVGSDFEVVDMGTITTPSGAVTDTASVRTPGAAAPAQTVAWPAPLTPTSLVPATLIPPAADIIPGSALGSAGVNASAEVTVNAASDVPTPVPSMAANTDQAGPSHAVSPPSTSGESWPAAVLSAPLGISAFGGLSADELDQVFSRWPFAG